MKSFSNIIVSLAGLAVLSYCGLGQPAYACDDEEPNPPPCGEDPNNPEHPNIPVTCEAYTVTYQHGTGNTLYNCVDTYEPTQTTINWDEECGFHLTTHDCDCVGRWWGCFDPNTEILMGDQVTTKKLFEVKNGDYLWNPLSGAPARVAKRVAGGEDIPLVEIRYNDKAIRVTQDHPMVVLGEAPNISLLDTLARETGYAVKQAKDISENDSLLGNDGVYHKVTSVKLLPVKTGQTVINVELESLSGSIQEHAVVANGIVTGDLLSQNALKQAKSF